MNRSDAPRVLPWDRHNEQLVAHAHPPDWRNPSPSGRYNLVVVGGGTAGLVTAAGAAGLGAKVALIERHLLGGDCLNVGCVPSKALIRAARVSAELRDAAEYGVTGGDQVRVDFAVVMERMRRLRAEISPHDSAARFRGLGVDVFLGDAKFTGRETLAVAGQTLRFARACIATGGRPRIPDVPGLATSGYLTNESVFSLTELPPRMAVVGGGPIGCELAQTFARFGARVTLIQRPSQILEKEDPAAAEIVARALMHDGVELFTRAELQQVETLADRQRLTLTLNGGESRAIEVDAILVSAGRRPNVEQLDLEAADVRYDERAGVEVDDYLRTSNKRIYAAGDVAGRYQFTHLADAHARIVLRNALFFGRAKASALTIPWCTFTSPEVAHVGMTYHEAQRQAQAIDTLRVELKQNDRARLDGAGDGFLTVYITRGTDKIRGATLVAPHAGEMISEITLAMVGQLGLKTIADTIHPYPTQAELIKRLADQYNRTRLTPKVKSWFKTLLRWRR